MAKVLNVILKIEEGDYTYSVLGHDKKPCWVHIDNHRSKKNSVLVPIEIIHKIHGLTRALDL